jgi:C-terminal processing protease CtpA/Prc
LAQPVPVGSFATRAGLRSFGVTSIDKLDFVALTRFRGYDVQDFLRELHRAGAVTVESGGNVGSSYTGRVVLLIDERCGSTTEALAAVLQELRRATLVGRRTAGAMLSSVEIPILGGWVLQLPEADFRTPAGRRVEGVGVTPDVIASRHWYRDGQLRAGLSLLEH